MLVLGTAMVVSGGLISAEVETSSKPTMEMSSGTEYVVLERADAARGNDVVVRKVGSRQVRVLVEVLAHVCVR